MRTLYPARKFQKDYKRCKARGYDLVKLVEIIELLRADEDLPVNCRPHVLSGNWAGYWECHVSPDWLLIYQFDDENNGLDLIRTGTHSDLF